MTIAQFCGRTRREFLWETGAASPRSPLTGCSATASSRPALPRRTSFRSSSIRWRRSSPCCRQGESVIFLFMYGGPSHVDTFDYKPKLYRARRQDHRGENLRPRRAQEPGPRRRAEVEVQAIWPVRQMGLRPVPESGHLRRRHRLHPFDVCRFADPRLRHAHDEFAAASSAAIRALGSWVNYGLGSENENLPGFVVMLDKTGGPISGPKNWSSGYMPAAYQGTVIRADQARPFTTSTCRAGTTREAQRAMLDRLRDKNQEHLATRTDNSRTGRPHRQLRAGVQDAATRARSRRFLPGDAENAGDCTASTSRRHRTSAASACWPAGWSSAACGSSRSIPAAPTTTTTGTPTPTWSSNHTKHAGNTDKPIAGLLKDLKQRGLLDSTLVVWGGEFGRQPTAEYATGHAAATTTPTASRCGWPAAASRAASASARPTSSAAPPSPIASMSRTCTPPS